MEIGNDMYNWLSSDNEESPFSANRTLNFPVHGQTDEYQYMSFGGLNVYIVRHTDSGDCFLVQVLDDVTFSTNTETETIYCKTQYALRNTPADLITYDLSGAETVMGKETVDKGVWTEGTTLTLSATVTGKDSDYTAARKPIFVMKNTTSGNRYTITGGAPDASGVSTASWTPSEAGLYELTVEYEGDNYLGSGISEEPQYYYAYAPINGALVIGGDAVMEFGETTSLTPMLLTYNETEGVVETPVDGTVTYKIFDSSGKEHLDQYKIPVEWVNDGVLTARDVGTFTVAAEYTVKSKTYTAKKVITVNKATLTITGKSVTQDVEDSRESLLGIGSVVASNGRTSNYVALYDGHLQLKTTLEAEKLDANGNMVKMNIDELDTGRYLAQPSVSISDDETEDYYLGYRLYSLYLADPVLYAAYKNYETYYVNYNFSVSTLANLYKCYNVVLVPGVITLTDLPKDGKIRFD